MRFPSLLPAALLLAVATTVAQSVPEVSTRTVLNIDSDFVANNLTSPATAGLAQVVWSTVVTVPGSSWVRLQYDGVLLSGARDRGSDGSFLRITSMRDGDVQTQHLVHVGHWQETSAYFNGDTVLVEILAHQGTGENRLILREAITGPAVQGPDTICGPTDDRALSSDPRVGRNQPTGCTSWMINDCNHCFLTAGHCAGTGLQVVQFNVPLSTSGGSLQHPPARDQYAVDTSSLQGNGGQGVGNDWAYFGVFANSTTGLTAYVAQGNQAFNLAVTPPAVSAGLNIRITGNGSTSSPVSPTWNLVQKTHVGPYATFSSSTVQYVTDTTGGNSGSPVILENTGEAIGIHTHGGCTSTGGQNSGTGSNHGGLRYGLANAQGVCFCPGLTFTYPSGLPANIQPDGSTTVRVVIGAGTNPPQPGTGTLHYSAGGAFQSVPMTQASPNVYDATFPSFTCFDTVRYYFSAQDSTSATFTDPRNAPSSAHTAVVAQSITTFRSYDFNTAPPGWTVVNTSVTDGAWARGTPAGGGARRDPPSDFDGSGQCWVTGLAANADLDGGPTVLTTELFNLSGLADPRLSYARWMSNDDLDDFLTIQISQDGGGNWITLEVVGDTPAGWVVRDLRIRDFVTNLNQVRVRFSVADQPNNSVTEAGIDAFKITDIQCVSASWTSFGAPCPGGSGVPALVASGVPALGTTFTVTLLNAGTDLPVMVTGLDNTTWAGGTLPASLQPFGFGPLCNLLVRPDAVQFLANVAGTGVWNLTVPNSPTLAGTRFYNQGFVLGTVPAVSFGGAGVVN